MCDFTFVLSYWNDVMPSHVKITKLDGIVYIIKNQNGDRTLLDNSVILVLNISLDLTIGYVGRHQDNMSV